MRGGATGAAAAAVLVGASRLASAFVVGGVVSGVTAALAVASRMVASIVATGKAVWGEDESRS